MRLLRFKTIYSKKPKNTANLHVINWDHLRGAFIQAQKGGIDCTVRDCGTLPGGCSRG